MKELKRKKPAGSPGRFLVCLIFSRRLGLDDALDRADRRALRCVVAAFALDAGGLIDDVGGAFGNRVGGAVWQAGAAFNAFFCNLHSHRKTLLNKKSNEINQILLRAKVTILTR